MTSQSEAIEMLAKGFQCRATMIPWQTLPEYRKDYWRTTARGFIAQMQPLLVADERAVWTEAIETYFDATAVEDVEKHVAAIRARSKGGEG